MSTSINTIYDDLKSSFKLARRNILSYFLANLGMMIAVAVLLGIVMIPIAIVAILGIGLEVSAWEAVGAGMAAWAQGNPWAVGGLAALVIIPLVAFFFTAVASIYGMSKDLLTHGETKAERAFSWFRGKFLTFFGAGALLTVIIVLPPAALYYAASVLMGYSVPVAISTVLSVITFVWVFITVGLCAMVFPAITHGKGVQDAFKESFDLARTRFERVYGLLSGVVAMFAISFGPVIVWGLTLAPLVPPADPTLFLNPITAAVLVWTVFVVFLWLLVLLPAVIIAFTKAYAEMTGKPIATQQPPPLPLV
ncbi:MAG: hypothetical protein ACFFAY_01680 [Promethearchaeota archaeon]